MNLLLDTSPFLWLANDSTKLSQTAMRAYEDPDNSIFLSVVSIWEIIQKEKLGKLPLPEPINFLLNRFSQQANFFILPFTREAAFRQIELPLIHRDPFDRMLICHALTERLTLLTPDSEIHKYDLPTLW